PPETTHAHVASEEPRSRYGQTAPRTAGWSRPGADDGGGRSPGSRVVALIPSSWGGALRLQLRAQRRTCTGFPFSPPFDGRHLRSGGLIAVQHGLSIAAPAARAPVCFFQRLVGTSQNHGRSKT